MSLITEDGTGLSTAESYISVTAANTRHTALGNTAWAALANDTLREQYLRRATQYMLQTYRGRWQGYRLTSTQALDWPRKWVCVDGFAVASNVVPTEIANACADLALKAAAGELAPDLERPVIREKVGPIETEFDRYASQQTSYQAIDGLLAPFLNGGGAMARLVRT